MSDEQPSELLAARRRKLEALREDGIEPFPHAYPGVRSIAEAKAPHEALEAGDETDDRVRVAGRLHARRGQGKAAFLDLDDRTGRMQLHARVDVLGEESLRALLDLDLGDLLGADGTVFRTRRGELSLKRRRLGRCSPSRCARRPRSTTGSPTSRRASATASST